MKNIILLIFVTLIIHKQSFSQDKSEDSIFEHLNHRYNSVWQERNSDFSSTGIHIFGVEYNIAPRVGYKINGMVPVYNNTWYKEGDVIRYSFREIVNFPLLLLLEALGETTEGKNKKFYPKSLLTFIVFLPNSEIRYQLNEKTYISIGTETNYFPLKIKGEDRGMMTSFKLEFPIEIHRYFQGDRFLLALFVKTNTYINFEGPSECKGATIGIKLLRTTNMIFD